MGADNTGRNRNAPPHGFPLASEFFSVGMLKYPYRL
jgi:hypothetical protein